jgi:hypothetical protein
METNCFAGSNKARPKGLRPSQNASFFSISASGSNFNPRNTQCIPACPVGPADRTGVIKIIAFLELKQKLTFFKGLCLSTKNKNKPTQTNNLLKVGLSKSVTLI